MAAAYDGCAALAFAFCSSIARALAALALFGALVADDEAAHDVPAFTFTFTPGAGPRLGKSSLVVQIFSS